MKVLGETLPDGSLSRMGDYLKEVKKLVVPEFHGRSEDNAHTAALTLLGRRELLDAALARLTSRVESIGLDLETMNTLIKELYAERPPAAIADALANAKDPEERRQLLEALLAERAAAS